MEGIFVKYGSVRAYYMDGFFLGKLKVAFYMLDIACVGTVKTFRFYRQKNEIDLASIEVPHPATSDRRSRMAGTGHW